MCLKEIVIKKQVFVYKDLYSTAKISFYELLPAEVYFCQYDTNSIITDSPIAKTPPISEDYREE